MSKYADGFIVPVPAGKVEEYRDMAQFAAGLWKEHGVLEYCECVLDDSDAKGMFPFSSLNNLEQGETVILAWIVYNSREERDAINAKVIADPRLAQFDCCSVFDFKRMAYGGFRMIVEG